MILCMQNQQMKTEKQDYFREKILITLRHSIVNQQMKGQRILKDIIKQLNNILKMKMIIMILSKLQVVPFFVNQLIFLKNQQENKITKLEKQPYSNLNLIILQLKTNCLWLKIKTGRKRNTAIVIFNKKKT